jgi:predicted PurR-regulated permease PerM
MSSRTPPDPAPQPAATVAPEPDEPARARREDAALSAQSKSWRLGASALAILGAVWLVAWLLAPILGPFLFSALLAYLFDPVVDRLERRGLGRTASVCLVFMLVLLLLLIVPLVLVPLLENQVRELAATVPKLVDWLSARLLPWLQIHLGVDPQLLDMAALKEALAEHWREAGGVAAQVVRYATRSGFAVAGWLAGVVLVPVVTFYLLRDWDRLVERVQDLLPRTVEPQVSALAREIDATLGAFLRGQLIVMIALGAFYAVGLWLVGLKLALLIGLVAGLVSFVPYLGVIVGVASAGIAMLVQSGQPLDIAAVVAVFVVGQLLEGFLLTPILVGDRIGLHPVAVIFAIMAGGQLFGLVGILLALPSAAVIAVLLRWAHREYKTSEVYRGDTASPATARAPPEPD